MNWPAFGGTCHPREIAARVAHFHEDFDVQADCSEAELERAARTSVALDRLVTSIRLGSLAYFYLGTGNADNEDAISSIILGSSLLTARGIPVAGEMEIKERAGDENHGQLRRGRIVHRVLRDGF